MARKYHTKKNLLYYLQKKQTDFCHFSCIPLHQSAGLLHTPHSDENAHRVWINKTNAIECHAMIEVESE